MYSKAVTLSKMNCFAFKWNSIIYLNSSHHVLRDSSCVQSTPNLPGKHVQVFVHLCSNHFSPTWAVPALSSWKTSSPSKTSLTLHVHVSLVLGSPELDPDLHMCLKSAEYRGKMFSCTCWNSPPRMQPRMPMTMLVHCQHGQLVTQQDPSDSQLVSCLSPLSLYWFLWLFLFRCRTLHFSPLYFMRFLSACFSSLLRSLWQWQCNYLGN